MAKYEFKLPHMGESVAEATITSWLKGVGDTIEADDVLVEVATDKVDSEIPCEVSGIITDILFKKDDVVQVGQVMAIIETEPNTINENQNLTETIQPSTENFEQPVTIQTTLTKNQESIESSVIEKEIQNITSQQPISSSNGERFYSPLVRTIAQQENISIQELEQIQGSGLEGRVTKHDILSYVEQRNKISPKIETHFKEEKQQTWEQPETQPTYQQIATNESQTEENISVQEPEIATINQEAESDIQQQKFYQEPEPATINQEAEPNIQQQNSYQETEPVTTNQEAEPNIQQQNFYQETEPTTNQESVQSSRATNEEVSLNSEQPIVNKEIIFPEGNFQEMVKEEKTTPIFAEEPKELHIKTPTESKPEEKPAPTYTPSQIDDVEVIEMTRMGKLISKYMVDSKRISAHVQSFTEVDVTRIWNWRNKVKKQFETREGEKFTFTPIFIEAVAKALRDFPMMNVSTDGERIFKKKHINIGMATALPNGDLIVPVIKNADQLSLLGLAKSVNDLAKRARENKLKPDEIKGGTYTVTNIGSFGNIFGTPIINQPEVGILAIGAIQKVPAVIETPEGDVLGIRYKLILSHSYDHRVVNGALGGMFVQRVAEYLEKWNMEREV
ncbi:dihydrolipoamide acetyltransferase family protein [Capnocytophaga catalasegens]|uniref:Dihydrolipoamide acetyltransferase component of pyruvate dehydrogenase complex n=1 Tax=Capnocytophaga catalasegens TaxID=1004260 RepID=A0AAV5AS85_9FLAO|nr:hypothetical protein RCZ03_09940 [Capnocytophaga catalasegens]GJM49374.1 hypothetical protein RCZ15_03490 [Capnocytophaga catalasegens]GJM52524.1 hypothetical protein RCZ16_08410 [Capnocytophaga catalasegens]